MPTPFDNYLENEVYSAHPVKLVCLLYRGAIESTEQARRHLATQPDRAINQLTDRATVFGADETPRAEPVTEQTICRSAVALRAMTRRSIRPDRY